MDPPGQCLFWEPCSPQSDCSCSLLASWTDTPSPAIAMRLGWLHSQHGGEPPTMTRSRTGPHRAWLHPRVMAGSAQENARLIDRRVSRPTSSRTRDDRIASAGIAVDPILRTGAAHVGTASAHVG